MGNKRAPIIIWSEYIFIHLNDTINGYLKMNLRQDSDGGLCMSMARQCIRLKIVDPTTEQIPTQNPHPTCPAAERVRVRIF